MSSPLPRAVLMMSIATEMSSARPAAPAATAPVVEALAWSLHRAGVMATWISACPVQWPHLAALGGAGQELALGARPAVLAAGRPAFGDELRRQVLRARAGGLVISTLFADDAAPVEHQDLLVKHGITAMCTARHAARRSSGAAGLLRASRWIVPLASRAGEVPQKLRWGLWRMPSAVSLAQEGKWRVRQAIDRAIATGGLIHLHVELAALEAAGRRQLEQVDSVVRQIAAYQERGRLVTRTIRDVAAALSRPRVAAPACSILRKRAA